MEKLIIIGSGGHAAELRDYIGHINKQNPEKEINVEGFIDDNRSGYDHYAFEEPFLGTIEDHKVREEVKYLMGIANIAYRRPIIERFLDKGASFTTLIHPSAQISPSAIIGEGVVISHNVSVGPKAEIGNYNMINSRATIAHDTRIGNYNFISPQVALSGNTTIGDENLLGTNSVTIPGMKVGSRNKIGAGMIVYKPVGDDETVFFRYKERIIAKGGQK